MPPEQPPSFADFIDALRRPGNDDGLDTSSVDPHSALASAVTDRLEERARRYERASHKGDKRARGTAIALSGGTSDLAPAAVRWLEMRLNLRVVELDARPASALEALANETSRLIVVRNPESIHDPRLQRAIELASRAAFVIAVLAANGVRPRWLGRFETIVLEAEAAQRGGFFGRRQQLGNDPSRLGHSSR